MKHVFKNNIRLRKMMKVYLAPIFLLFMISTYSQDRIILLDGSKEKVEISEISDKHVFYFKLNEAKKRKIRKKALLAVSYDNGSVVFFDDAVKKLIENLKVFAGIKYMIIEDAVDPTTGRVDRWKTGRYVRNILSTAQFILINSYKRSDDVNAIDNPCLVATCKIRHSIPTSGKVTLFTYIDFYDCNNELIYSTEGSDTGSSEGRVFESATKKALYLFKFNPYEFNPEKTPIIARSIENLSVETEESLRLYFSKGNLDPIEGIWKSYQSNKMGHYRMGIKRKGYKYIGVVLESYNMNWIVGEVKAELENASVKGLYSVNWKMKDKSRNESFAIHNKLGLQDLEIEFTDGSGNKQKENLIKLFPASEQGNSFDRNDKESEKRIKGYGTGFVISKSGLIVTNHHVIEGGNSFEATFDLGIKKQTYNLELVISDEVNDIAVLRIEDSQFTEFNDPPYSLSNEHSTGENIFLIGFPFPQRAGENAKLTDGIISSTSGWQDDVRQIQISAPVQPGNSGGPLFNDYGEIIGVVTARFEGRKEERRVENMNYAMKISYLYELLNSKGISNEITKSNSLGGLQMSERFKKIKQYICLIKVK